MTTRSCPTPIPGRCPPSWYSTGRSRPTTDSRTACRPPRPRPSTRTCWPGCSPDRPPPVVTVCGGRSAGDDDRTAARCFGQAGQVAGVAGQDPVAWTGQQDDGGINRIAGASHPEQHTSLAALWRGHRADVHGPEQQRQTGLAAVTIAPDLGDHYGVTTQLHAVLLGYPQPGHHRPVTPVDGNKCARAQDERAHAADSRLVTPSSRSA